MATLTATIGSSSLTLTNGSPYSLVAARGMSSAGVRRVTSQGPAQDGDTDLGYRLDTRTIELTIGIRATSDVLLDGYRQTFTSFFKPLQTTPVQLRYTGDNSAVRQIDCYVVGKIKLDLNPPHRAGHYHEATVTLKAPDPAWYNPTPGSVTVVGTSLIASQWWLAGGAIGSAQVAEYGTAPTQGQVWTYTGTPNFSSFGDTYTIAFRSGQEPVTDGKFAFFAGAGGGSPSFSFRTLGTTNYAAGATYTDGYWPLGTAAMAAGTNNYFITAAVDEGGINTFYFYRNKESLLYFVDGAAFNFALAGTARRWRSDATNSVGSRWSEALHKYAVYVPGLADSQISALSTLMDLPDNQTNAQTLTIPYAGNLPEYPLIAITGPVTNPSVSNLTTGETLDFGTITIGAGTTYFIDTRYGYKTVLSGTVSKRHELTQDSDVATFHLEPTTNDTNVLYLNGTAMGTATRFSVAYYNRYTSF